MYYQEDSENSDTIWEPEDKLQELENLLEIGNEDSSKIRMMTNFFLVDLFRSALAVPEQMTRIHGIMSRLSEHSDPLLRSSLMKMVPRLAYLCCDSDKLDCVDAHLWPLLLSCLPDKDIEVRKASETGLVILMKRKYVAQEKMEDVCPFVVEISKKHVHRSWGEYYEDFGSLKDMGSEMLDSLYLSLPCLSWRRSVDWCICYSCCRRDYLSKILSLQIDVDVIGGFAEALGGIRGRCGGHKVIVRCILAHITATLMTSMLSTSSRHPATHGGAAILLVRRLIEDPPVKSAVICPNAFISQPYLTNDDEKGEAKEFPVPLTKWLSYVEVISQPVLMSGLMGKMAPLIGREATEKHFLDRFVCQSFDERPFIREMCAKALGYMCTVLGTETTEKLLLPLFVQLSRDKCANVRQSCVKVFLSVSCSCSLVTRKSVLTAVFMRLLMDAEERVQMTAFGFLGAFICTFADPTITRLDYDKNGGLIFVGHDGYEFRMQGAHTIYSRDSEPIENLEDVKRFPNELVEITDVSLDFFFGEDLSGHSNLPGTPWTIPQNESETTDPGSDPSTDTGADPGTDPGTDPDTADSEKPDDSFNTFRFWRTPLPQIDSFDLEPEHDEIRNDLGLIDNALSFLSEKLTECSPSDLEDVRTESVISSSSSPDSGWSSAETTPHVESTLTADPNKCCLSPIPSKWLRSREFPTEIGDGLLKRSAAAAADADATLPGQEIVPQLLLDCFVSMTVPQLLLDCFVSMKDPMRNEFIQDQIVLDCAYNLPAVALTLGPTNWPHIKNAYKCLSMNMQWSVRRRVVSSIHKLASILGEEIASKDLAPIFERFIRDLDQVKIKALEHLADFLRLVNPETRNSFLPLLKEFLEIDYDWNWRYREEFAQQLRLLLDLFTPADSLQHLEPLATLLLCDKVAAVRHKAVLLFLDLLIALSRVPEFQKKLLYVLLKEFAEHSSWRRRQVFVFVCSEIARQVALGSEDFGTLLLDHLAALAKDSVTNVRLGVARCLSLDVISTGYISSSSPHYSTTLEILERLKTHSDSDVRHFAALHEDMKNISNDLNVPLLEAVKLES